MVDKTKKKKGKLKIFSKKSKRREDDDDDDDDDEEEDYGRQQVRYPAYQQDLQASEPINHQQKQKMMKKEKKKKKGFKSLFKGKTKKNPQTGRDENSLYDYDPHNPPQQYSGRPPPHVPGSQRTRMDPKILAQIEDSDSDSDSSSSDEDEFHTSLKPVEEGDEEEEEESDEKEDDEFAL